MNRHRSANVVRILVLLILTLTAVPAALAQDTNKIEGRLRDVLAAEGTADLVVRFAEQADLSPAYTMDWEARGRFVYDTLQKTAARSQARAIQHLDRLGLDHTTFIAGNELYVRAGNLQVANDLAALPEVAFIRAPRTYYVDPVLSRAPAAAPHALDWGLVDVRADDFWATFGMQGDGILVANIDTGVQWNHPALDQAYKCPGSPGSPVCWADPSNICGGSPCDNNSHGTHTMGTMVGDDDPGLAYQVGMAPNAQWIACKGCESSSCSEYALNTCADWILAPGGNPANRPHVVNNSWGGGGCDNWYLTKVNAWRAAGTFPAFSAGNSGSSCSSLGSPGDYQQSFGSAAHDVSRNIASFSSRGPSCYGHDPYTKPNISAPGVNVCSSVPGGGFECSGWSGTSMASPHSAGAVALLWSCNPGLIGQIDQTFEILQDNADPPPAGNCGAPPDGEGNYTYGYGYLNVYNAGLLWCGDVGWIDGTVTDASTSNPIVGARVVAVNQSGPGSFSDTTDATGYYTMTVLEGTYNMTATAYGYLPGTAAGVVVVADQVTTQNFQLQPAPTYVVSGTVTELGTGNPLYARVQIVGDPVPPVWTDPGTGYYEITLAEGTYTFHVTAAGHGAVDRVVVVNRDQTQDFALPTLPCILLVDDDQDDPDVQAYYTDPLDAMGVTYNVWDVLIDGEPTAEDLAGYRMVFWFTGYPYSGSFTDANESAVAAYLDAGGLFFLSSEDYLWEMGLTPFGQTYLGISDYTDDMEETDVVGNAGNPIGGGLGPYYLTPPAGWTGSLWTDYVTGPETPFRFQGSGQNNSTNKDGGDWKSAFFAWPLEGVSGVTDRVDVLTAIVTYFGGCGAVGRVTGRVTHEYYGTPIAGASVTAQPVLAGAGIDATTDPNGRYTLTLALGTYDITAQKAGYTTAVAQDVVVSETVVVQDFVLNSAVAIVTPGSLHAYVTPSGTVTLLLNIDNPGGLDLDYSILEFPPALAGQTIAPAGAGPADARKAPAQVGRRAPRRTPAPEDILFNEGFEGGAVPPAGWTRVQNNPRQTWKLATFAPHGGVYYTNCEYDDALAQQDEWLLSPELMLSEGTLSLWSYGSLYWCRDTYDNCDLDIYIVVGDVGGGDDIFVGTADDDWAATWEWAQSTFDLTPLLPGGPVRIGFNYYGLDGAEVAMDDIVLDGVVGGDIPWVAEDPVTGTVPAGTDLDVDIIFTALPPYNVIGESYTGTLVVRHNDPETAPVAIPITMTVVGCIPIYDADFAWAPLSPLAGDPVVFTGTASGGEPITFTWDFGDGGVGVGANVSHIYDAAGVYTVTMTAANACPSELTVEHTIVVQERPCTPVEIVAVGGGVDGCVVDLFAVVTGTEPFEYLWDFAAFGTYTTAGVSVNFGVSGSYPYTLTVSNCGGDDVFTETLTVTCTPPCADVQIVTYTADISGCAVDFALEVTGTAPFTYLWEFGDGVTSTQALPTHTYTQTGTYNVTAHAYNCAAGHDMVIFDVSVACGAPRYFVYLPLIYKDATP